jgi:hypothetical protein
MGLSPINRITSEFTCAVVTDEVGNGDDLFPLAISILIDRHAEAVAGLPRVFHIWILLMGANDGFATDAHAGRLSVHQRNSQQSGPLFLRPTRRYPF